MQPKKTKRMKAEIWDLRLYVAGQTSKSIVAFGNLKNICEQHLKGKYRIEIIDLLKNPKLAKGDQILAIPTLVRKQAMRYLRTSKVSNFRVADLYESSML